MRFPCATRHVAVDTLGLPIKCQVTAADVQDRDALPDLLRAVSRKSPWIEVAFADGGYAGQALGRRTNLGLAEPGAPPRKGLRGNA